MPAQPSILSLLPQELQLSILEMLPTPSVLNLFLASPDFRQHARRLSSSFWKSRIFLDLPWCADMVLSQIDQEGSDSGRVQFNLLFGLLKEALACPGYYAECFKFMGLKNRRRIWLNCERILKDISELQHVHNKPKGPNIDNDTDPVNGIYL